jgi:hypothetical protein
MANEILNTIGTIAFFGGLLFILIAVKRLEVWMQDAPKRRKARQARKVKAQRQTREQVKSDYDAFVARRKAERNNPPAPRPEIQPGLFNPWHQAQNLKRGNGRAAQGNGWLNSFTMNDIEAYEAEVEAAGEIIFDENGHMVIIA